MRALTKVFGIAATAGVLLATTLSPASADTIDSTVSGSSLTAITSGATLSGVTLNGTGTQTATAPASSVWSITDARGTGVPWSLSVQADAPTSDPGSAAGETTLRTLPVGGLKIAPGTITAGAGADTTAISGPTLAMTGSEQALVSAAGPNKGTYSLTPVYSLDVPANAYRSNYTSTVGPGEAMNPYTSTITYTIA